MRRFSSTQSRLLSSLLSFAMIAAPLHAVEAAPAKGKKPADTGPSVEDLYAQGQEKFDAGEFGAAGDLWGQAVRALPESPDTSATRQTIMKVALDAYVRGYRGDSDRTHIDKAKTLIDEYQASVDAAGGALSSEIASEKGKIEDILAELAAAEAAANEPEPEPEPEPDTTTDVVYTDEKPGQGLIIGGAVLLVVGAGGLGMMGAGLALGGAAQKDYEMSIIGSPEREDIRKKGKTANIVAGVGAGLGVVGVGAGVALLILGLQANKNARYSKVLVVPEAGPGYTGLALTGRF